MENGWGEWKNHVLIELKRMNGNFEDHEKLDQTRHEEVMKQLAIFKTKEKVLMGLLTLAISLLGVFWIK